MSFAVAELGELAKVVKETFEDAISYDAGRGSGESSGGCLDINREVTGLIAEGRFDF
jgi:hypothetical protein